MFFLSVFLVFLIAVPAQAKIKSGTVPGAVGIWNFQETAGTIVKDESGKGNLGSLTGGAVLVSGIQGRAVFTDGVNDNITMDNPNSDLCFENGKSFGVGIAFRTRGLKANVGLMSNEQPGCCSGGWSLMGDDGTLAHKVNMQIPNNVDIFTTWQSNISSSEINDGKAHAIIFFYDSTKPTVTAATFWLDGKKRAYDFGGNDFSGTYPTGSSFDMYIGSIKAISNALLSQIFCAFVMKNATLTEMQAKRLTTDMLGRAGSVQVNGLP